MKLASMKQIRHVEHFLMTVIFWFVQKHFLDYILTKSVNTICNPTLFLKCLILPEKRELDWFNVWTSYHQFHLTWPDKLSFLIVLYKNLLSNLYAIAVTFKERFRMHRCYINIGRKRCSAAKHFLEYCTSDGEFDNLRFSS